MEQESEPWQSGAAGEHLTASALDSFHDLGLSSQGAKQAVEVGSGDDLGPTILDRIHSRRQARALG